MRHSNDLANRAYVKAIDALIPEAFARSEKRLADAALERLWFDPNDPEEVEAWRDYFFHDEMNKAAIKAGLRRPAPRGVLRHG